MLLLIQLDLCQHFFDSTLYLCLCIIIGKTQFRAIVKSTLYRKITVYDIILRNVAKLSAECCVRFIVILPIIKDHTTGWTQSVERFQQRGLTSARTTNKCYK